MIDKNQGGERSSGDFDSALPVLIYCLLYISYRIECWDDEIDTIRSFDADSQRSIERHEEISIYPAAEMVFTAARIQEGLAKIKKDVDKGVRTFQKAGKAEETGHLKHIYEEAKEAFEYSFGSTNMDSLIRYFYAVSYTHLDVYKRQD